MKSRAEEEANSAFGVLQRQHAEWPWISWLAKGKLKMGLWIERGLPLGATEYDAAGLPPITGGCYRSLRAKRISAKAHAKRFRTVIEKT